MQGHELGTQVRDRVNGMYRSRKRRHGQTKSRNVQNGNVPYHEDEGNDLVPTISKFLLHYTVLPLQYSCLYSDHFRS